MPLAHPPGHAQADFGEAVVIIGGVEQKAHFFVMDLPHSDACFVRTYQAATSEAWVDGHVHAFAFFGKVPASVLYDNDRCMVAKILPDGTRQRAKLFSGFLSHYLFHDRYNVKVIICVIIYWIFMIIRLVYLSDNLEAPMPTVVIASPKGGAGKSTAAILLGTELAHAGANVVMLDCDPNHSLTLWADRGPLPERIKVLSSVLESDIVKTIKQHDTDGQIVVVDLEGVASRLVSRAISQADLVITPMRATTLDATIGVRALQLIAEEEEALDRKIPHAVVFTMTKAIRSKQHSGIAESLAGQGVDLINPPLMERAAFSALFEFGGNLRNMPAQGNMDGAIENAAKFAQAVYKRLTEGV